MKLFPLTRGWLSFIGSMGSEAWKQQHVGIALWAICFAYAVLPAAILVDLCFFVPGTILVAFFGESADARQAQRALLPALLLCLVLYLGQRWMFAENQRSRGEQTEKRSEPQIAAVVAIPQVGQLPLRTAIPNEPRIENSPDLAMGEEEIAPLTERISIKRPSTPAEPVKAPSAATVQPPEPEVASLNFRYVGDELRFRQVPIASGPDEEAR